MWTWEFKGRTSSDAANKILWNFVKLSRFKADLGLDSFCDLNWMSYLKWSLGINKEKKSTTKLLYYSTSLFLFPSPPKRYLKKSLLHSSNYNINFHMKFRAIRRTFWYKFSFLCRRTQAHIVFFKDGFTFRISAFRIGFVQMKSFFFFFVFHGPLVTYSPDRMSTWKCIFYTLDAHF